MPQCPDIKKMGRTASQNECCEHPKNPAGMECLTKAHDIYLFCMSLSFTDLLKKEFNAVACAEILDPRAFISRWLNALPEGAKQEGKHVARKVCYYKPEDVPGNVWALPDLIVRTKLKRFEYQHEYRLAYTTTDAFAFQNVSTRSPQSAALAKAGRTSQ
jgi:hypothetical protein